MNPILIMSVFIVGLLLWLVCASLYKPFGDKIYKLINNSLDAMKNDKEDKEWNQEEKES